MRLCDKVLFSFLLDQAHLVEILPEGVGLGVVDMLGLGLRDGFRVGVEVVRDGSD